ncbi:hypothetical protein KR009_006691 [Drosophila setifemur]|nr:hypothetical protein KR009_006691 [Drosophila setifemur]
MATSEELMDEEFECLRRVALAICQTLGRPKDRQICRSTLDEVAKFNQLPSLSTKENVHKFMVFYLKVLRWTQRNQPLGIYQQWYGKNFGKDEISRLSHDTSPDEFRAWSEDGQSFLAMKTFEDGSTLIYNAVAKDPRAGWSEFGLKSLMDKRLGCPEEQG